MAFILLLEDNELRIERFEEHFAGHELHIHRTTTSFLNELAKGDQWDYIFLDHDLGKESMQDPNEQNTGMEAVRWMENNQAWAGTIIVHSWNSSAAGQMVKRLQKEGYDVKRWPYDPEDMDRWHPPRLAWQRVG
jgi:CheY-like chemotaxis protein